MSNVDYLIQYHNGNQRLAPLINTFYKASKNDYRQRKNHRMDDNTRKLIWELYKAGKRVVDISEAVGFSQSSVYCTVRALKRQHRERIAHINSFYGLPLPKILKEGF